jgi:hypothetical protein
MKLALPLITAIAVAISGCGYVQAADYRNCVTVNDLAARTSPAWAQIKLQQNCIVTISKHTTTIKSHSLIIELASLLTPQL